MICNTRRNVTALATILIASTTCFFSPSAQADINDGLIAHYTFDGTSGSVIDSTGSYNGTNYGAIRGVSGKIGNAFQFDGYDDFVDTLPVGVIPTTSTISLWMRPAETIPSGNQVFGSLQNASSGKDGIVLNYYCTDEKVRMNYVANNCNQGEMHSLNGSFPLDTWSHLTYTWDSSNGAKLYANGNLTATGSFSSPPSSHDRALMFGKSCLSQNLGFDGMIDDVKIWNRSLSANEVAFLSTPRPQTHVLSVGIRDVARKHVNDLMAREVGAAFEQFGSVDSSRVLELSGNSDALDNRVNILQAIQQTQVQPGDTFIFYIATHGFWESEGNELSVNATKTMFTREETTGNEVLWMGSDSSGDVHISDDMLHDMFTGEEWEDVNKLFIIDSCFSGGFWGSTLNGDTGDLASLQRSAIIAASSEADVSFGVPNLMLEVRPQLGLGLVDALNDLSGESTLDFDDLAEAIGNKAKLYEGISGQIMGAGDFEDLWGSDGIIDAALEVESNEDFSLVLSNPVPEPSTLALLATGMAGLLFVAWRRRRGR